MITEQEQVAAQRIVTEAIANHAVQAIESLAHVDRVNGKEDLGCRAKAEHGRQQLSAMRINCGNSAWPHSMRRPLPSTSANGADRCSPACSFTSINLALPASRPYRRR